MPSRRTPHIASNATVVNRGGGSSIVNTRSVPPTTNVVATDNTSFIPLHIGTQANTTPILLPNNTRPHIPVIAPIAPNTTPILLPNNTRPHIPVIAPIAPIVPIVPIIPIDPLAPPVVTPVAPPVVPVIPPNPNTAPPAGGGGSGGGGDDGSGGGSDDGNGGGQQQAPQQQDATQQEVSDGVIIDDDHEVLTENLEEETEAPNMNDGGSNYDTGKMFYATGDETLTPEKSAPRENEVLASMGLKGITNADIAIVSSVIIGFVFLRIAFKK